MNTFKRAILYLTRKRGRTAILVVIFFIVSFLIMTCFTIKIHADREIHQIDTALGTNFKAEVSDSTMMAYYDPSTGYTGEYMYMSDVDKIIQSDSRINDYYIEFSSYSWVNLDLRPGVFAKWHGIYNSYDMTDEDLIKERGETYEYYDINMQTTTIHGCTDTELHQYFLNGAYSLADGRHITKEDTQKAIISEELASKNGLSVGDTFTLQRRDFFYTDSAQLVIENGKLKTDIGKPYEMEIVGIFHINFEQVPRTVGNTDEDKFILTAESSFAENEIFCDFDTIIESSKPSYYVGDTSIPLARFYIDNSDNLENVMETARNVVNTEFITISADKSSYAADIAPLEHLSLFSVIIMTATIIGCIVTISLIMNMWVKSRRKETGILLSIGSSKKEVIIQYMAETLIISALGILAAIIISTAVIPVLGNLANAAVSPKVNDPVFEVYDSAGKVGVQVTKISAPVTIEYSLTPTAVFLSIVTVLFSGVLSVMLSAKNIIKLKPRDIFSKW